MGSTSELCHVSLGTCSSSSGPSPKEAGPYMHATLCKLFTFNFFLLSGAAENRIYPNIFGQNFGNSAASSNLWKFRLTYCDASKSSLQKIIKYFFLNSVYFLDACKQNIYIYKSETYINIIIYIIACPVLICSTNTTVIFLSSIIIMLLNP